MRTSPLLLCFTVFTLACDTATTPPLTGDPDAGPPEDGGTTAVTEETIGRFAPGPTASVLTDETTHVALIGTIGATIDPRYFGETELETGDTEIRGGLVALDTNTGHARIFGVEDGVPAHDYLGDGSEAGSGPAPILSLAWIDRGAIFAGAAGGHVMRGEISAAGNIAFTSRALRKSGAETDAFSISIAASSGELFVGTDQGIAAIDATTLELARFYDSDPWARVVVPAMIDGAKIVGLAGPMGGAGSDAVYVITPGTANFEKIPLPIGSLAFDAVGLEGRALIAATDASGRGVVYAISALGAGVAGGAPYLLETAIDADTLAAVSEHAFVPQTIAYDPTTETLFLGGAISVAGPMRTGGLVSVKVAVNGAVEGAPQRIFDRRDGYTQLFPWETSVLELDERGRAWFAGYNLCSEHRKGVVGLMRLEREGDEARLVRPMISGVRSIARGPDGETWLGLRDEKPGLRCDGISVAQNVCRLRADGACEIYTPFANANADRFAAAPGARSIAFGDMEAHELAIASIRDATFMRGGSITRALPTQFEPGISLEMTKAAWGEGHELWLGSELEWFSFPGDTEEQAEAVNRRSPQGLGWIWFGADARPLAMRRYTRVPTDLNVEHEEIGGLPSGTVYDVLPLAGPERALVATGRERWGRPYDHMRGDLAPSGVNGGIAMIDRRLVHVFTATGGVTLGDVVALATAGGEYFALDSAAGVLELDLEARTARVVVPAVWSGFERALSMAIDASGRIAVGTNKALYTGELDGVLEKHSDDASFVWTVAFMGDGLLYAGSDRGLARIDLAERALPARGPNGLFAREPWPLDRGCDGAETCACSDPDQCAPGLSCLCANGDLTQCACDDGMKLQK